MRRSPRSTQFVQIDLFPLIFIMLALPLLIGLSGRLREAAPELSQAASLTSPVVDTRQTVNADLPWHPNYERWTLFEIAGHPNHPYVSTS